MLALTVPTPPWRTRREPVAPLPDHHEPLPRQLLSADVAGLTAAALLSRGVLDDGRLNGAELTTAWCPRCCSV